MSATFADHEPIREGTPSAYYQESVKIPGYGDTPDRCRPMKPVGFCEHGHVVLGRSSCQTRGCPDHWRDYLEQRVISMVARMAAYREAQDLNDRRMCHVVASPPQDRRYSVRELFESRSDAYDAMEAAGIEGGTVVTHPFRTNESGDELYRTVREHGDIDDDTGKWQVLRESCESHDELTEYVEASPHYHALAAADDIDGSKAPDGWIVENIRSFKAFHYRDTEAYRDMVATAYYVLTHGAVKEDRSTTTYFGSVHPNSFDPEEAVGARKWRKIQREAEEAVKGVSEEAAEEDDHVCHHGPRECPHDDCTAHVVDVLYLDEYLDDDDFISHVLSFRDGRKRLAQLRGALAYWQKRTDRPPPGAVTSEARYKEWLEARGETFQPAPSQVSLSAAIMG